MPAEVYREAVNPSAENNPHSYALQMTGSNRRVLEVGCSVGHVTEHLVAAGNTVVGVEIDAAAADEARRFADRVHVLDLDVTPLSTVENDEFDVIILGDVLEHLRDPGAALADMMSLLAPAGRVIISIPNVAHVDVRMMLLEGRWEYQETGLLDATHLRWFTKSSLRSLVHEAGLVATRLERVRIGRYGSDIELDVHRPRTDALAFAEADPEAYTFQFVVEAVRSTDAAAAVDVLSGDAVVDWPSLDHSSAVAALAAETAELRNRIADLEAEGAALRAHLDAWEHSRLARLARPLRSALARARRVLRP